MTGKNDRSDFEMEIVASLARIEERLKKLDEHSRDIKDIKETLNSHQFQRLLILAERIGDQESLINIMGRCYGDKKKVSGFDALPEMIDRYVKDKEDREENKKTFMKKIIESLAQFAIKIIPIIVFTSISVCAIFILFVSKNSKFMEILNLLIK